MKKEAEEYAEEFTEDYAEKYADRDDAIFAERKNEWKIMQIKDKLFDTTYSLNTDVLVESIKVLHALLGCVECSLWKINYNSTRKDNLFSSASLVYRECASAYFFSNRTDYVYDLRTGLFNEVIKAQPNNSVFIFSKKEALEFGYISKDFVDKASLKEFIVFPVFDSDGRINAFLEMSYEKCDWDEAFWDDLSKFIHPFFSAAFTRNTSAMKESLMKMMISIHREHKNNEIEVLFDSILEGVLLKACPAQGASFFIWDTYQNGYNLIASKGLEQDSELVGFHFKMGEDQIGHIGQTGKPLINDEIAQEAANNQISMLVHVQWNKSINTEMFIPVTDPSNENEVLGVLKLVNKTNKCNDKIMDYFNDGDVEMMLYAANYLALIITTYYKEERQYNLIDELTHEIITPANAISKSANRLYTHLTDQEFLFKNLSPYLKNIIDFAELQKWQALTTRYLSRNRRKMPFNVRYSIRPNCLYEVIKKSIEITKHIAIKYGGKFDNIRIDPSSDRRLTINIDKDVFITVFYNLFTNAIKYRDPKDSWEQFYIGISYMMNEDSLVIEVADNGIGINKEEEDSIFEIGYRSNSAIRINASGYGIGLTVVKQIVEDFGGMISIAHYRKPTVFQIIIPKEKIL